MHMRLSCSGRGVAVNRPPPHSRFPRKIPGFRVAGRLCKAKNISRLNGLQDNSRSPAKREFAQHNRELFHSNRELTGIAITVLPTAADYRRLPRLLQTAQVWNANMAI
jgi:hypothetical protein